MAILCLDRVCGRSLSKLYWNETCVICKIHGKRTLNVVECGISNQLYHDRRHWSWNLTPTTTKRSFIYWRWLTGATGRRQWTFWPDLRSFQKERNVTDILMSLDVFQHGPLLVIPIISSLSVGLKLLDSGVGSSARADSVHWSRDALAKPRLDGPNLPEDLEKHRLHALVHATRWRQDVYTIFRCLQLSARFGGAAMGHWQQQQQQQARDGCKSQLVDS